MLNRWTRALVLASFAIALSACAGPGHRAFADQLTASNAAPVLSVQGYVITNAEDENRLRGVWQQMAELMKRKPGFIAADLHPGAANSGLWIEFSKWESAAQLRSAFADPRVQETAQKLPKVQMNHLFVASGGGHATPAADLQGDR